MSRKGILYVVSGPSGTGKNTVLDGVFSQVSNLYFSVSATTRAPREGELDGVNYHYVTTQRFDEMIANRELLEYVEKYTNKYGTVKSVVDEMLNSGKDVVLDIETVGASKIRALMPESVLIFLAPPSIKELLRRLEKRGTETEDNKRLRYELSVEEMQRAYIYDYIVINDDLESCVKEVSEIMRAERCRIKYNTEIIEKIINTK